jgi:hypothetical protein
MGRDRRLRVDPQLLLDFKVPESGDDLEAVVNGLGAAAALPLYVPVFEPGDDVFDADFGSPMTMAAGFVSGVKERRCRWSVVA